MIRRELVLVVLIALVVLGLQSVMQPPVAADRVGKPPFVANEVLVNFRSGVSTADIATFYAKYGLLEMKRLGAAPDAVSTLRLARAKPGKMTDTEGFIRKLGRDSRVEYVELNYILSLALHPNNSPDDTSYGELWGLNNTGQSGGTPDADIDAPEAWHAFTTGSSSVIVGVIDTGVNYNHPDLVNNIWTNQIELNGTAGADDDNNGYIDDIHGYNAYGNNGNPMDDNGHGSHTAGTIGAEGNNSLGVVGVNWDVSIAACKFLNSIGQGSTADAIQCFDYFNQLRADGHNVVVTNNSWGGGGFSQALMDAMAGDPAKRILHAAAAGNGDPFFGNPIDNDLTPHYPSSYNLDNIIAVAATDRDDDYASFSNYGKFSVDLAAPGVSILSTVLSSGYSTYNGTSMATPHVAGAAALLWAKYPNLTATNVKALILTGVDGLGGGDKTFTNGRLNVYDAINAMEVDPNPPGEVIDLDVSGSGMSSLILSWNASGDDGMTGTASSYDIRYSATPINIDNWASASPATGEPSPLPPNSPQSFTICGLDSDTTYHAGLRVPDNVGNESDISVGSAATWVVTVPTELHDDAENCQAEWTADGLWHKSNHQSNSPNRSWYYGIEGAWNYSTGARNSGTLTTAVDLTGATGGDLTFSYWREVEYWSAGTYDETLVEVSYDGDGGPWTPVWQMDSGDLSEATWKQASVPLNPGMVNIRFSFDTMDGQFNTSEGWYVDDVHVIADVPGTEPAAPSTPDLVAASDTGWSDTDDITKDNTPTFTGTAEAGSTASIYSGGTEVGSGVATGGVYSITTTSALADGLLDITATATNGVGTSPASGALGVTIDTQAPNDPTGVSSTSHSINVPSKDNYIDVTWTPATDNGLAAVDGYAYVFNTTSDPTCDQGKDLEETATGVTSSALAEGTYDFHICTLDNAGNWTATGHLGPFLIDNTPPSFSSGSVAADGTTVTVIFDEALANSAPLGSVFVVTGSGSGVVSGTGDPGLISGTDVTFTLASALEAGETATLAYTQPASDPRIQDAAGNLTTTFSSAPITVNTPPPPPNTAPTATITSPTNGSAFLTTDGITFSGSGNDAEDGVLTGTSLVWTSNLSGQIGTGGSVTASLSAGSHTITLTATDSLAATGTDSVSITVNTPPPPPNTAPTATITSPTNGSAFLTTDGITFSGSGNDAEDGVLTGTSLVWTSNLNGQIGTGGSVTASLSAGSHTITLTATDSLTATGTDSVSITVTANAGPATMHVGDLNGASTKLNKGQWSGQVTVKVDTAAHFGVEGATVWGFFSQNGWASDLMDCTTVLGGTCTIDSGPLQKKSGSATFTVDSVTHATLTYDSTGNHDPDVDSFIAADGTISIELSK